jgi:ATP-dependent exoDNAse (exonuclease V) beta subunit
VQESSFKIYNASAGSGKTYALSKAYLKIVLSSPRSFKRILAITFTNKAVNEMKKRILASLFTFSKTTSIKVASPLFIDVMEELDMTQESLKKLSKTTLRELLHNYAFFDISTIDKFTHRLIRTFAKDLKISQNFEVILDTDLLLDEAVSRVIAKAGEELELTKVLMDFALEKIDDDRSWDIAFDLTKIGKLLFNENNVTHIKNLENKSIADFSALKKNISKAISKCQKEIITHANLSLQLIESNHLEFSDFSSSYFPKFLTKIAEGNLNQDFKSAWKQNFETKPLYNKTCKEPTKSTLDVLHAEFSIIFREIEHKLMHFNFLQNAYRNLVPLTLLNAIQKEIKSIQKEKDQLSISEFNTIISNEIKNQPAPFIYERLGEKYRHYFIDEFQDTSKMQWNNLIPLIGNALESEDEQGQTGSLFLVGDAKQAIYRWRGGEAEQFLELATLQTNPFSVQGETRMLPRNYRSHDEIVHFNNTFFQSISSFLEHPKYRLFFEDGSQQETNQKEGGYVQLSFLEDADEAAYGLKTMLHIRESLSQGFDYMDICILVRKKKHGVLLANHLMKEAVPVVSSESLLLSSSPKVKFLISLARHTMQPNEAELNYDVLHFLSSEQKDTHTFIEANLKELEKLLLNSYGFNGKLFRESAIYDGMEHAIKVFDLIPNSDAHLTAFMDTVFEVQQKDGADIQSFLTYWDKKGKKLSISTPETTNAVQIMTIHKSKGLEFPVVIFPYANTYIFEEIEPKLWTTVTPASFSGFKELLLSKKQEVREYGEQEALLFDEEQQKLHLDAFNLLYVALTRAETSLYVISEKDLNKDGSHRPNYFSGLFIHFLQSKGLWDKNKEDYTFGALPKRLTVEHTKQNHLEIPYLYTHKNRSSFKILTKAGMLWDTTQEEAIKKGNTIHYILSQIHSYKNLEAAMKLALQKGFIMSDELASIKDKVLQVVTHPKLIPLFGEKNTVFNEKEILLPNRQKLRPDRVVLINNKASIIDYKTGRGNPAYKEQILSYANALESMGYIIDKKIIVYIDATITTEFI